MNTKTLNYTSKDFVSDQEIRWCPGCGDFSILKQVQNVLPKLEIEKEKIVFVSGIGCSSRFPYYMNTNGIHSIHGRAPALATGLKLANPSLYIWVITGDGDALSIGGNHFLHVFRRDINLNILLFNNEIYGLTKGQYSPTSKINTISKTSPEGTIHSPLNPLFLALAAGATFVGRSIDKEAKHLQECILQNASHKGASLLEIYQNCHIFNDGVFDNFTNKISQKETIIFVEEGKPLLFGDGKALILEGFMPKIVNENDTDRSNLWIHDIEDRNKALILSQLGYEGEFGHFPRVMGIMFRKEKKNLIKKTSQNLVNIEFMEQLIKGNDFLTKE